MSRKPRDLTFKVMHTTLTFRAFDYAYDKGSDGRIDMDDSWDYELSRENQFEQKGPEIHLSVKQKQCFYGLTYKDLKMLAKWADQAAEYIKNQHTKKSYKGSAFDPKASVNDL